MRASPRNWRRRPARQPGVGAPDAAAQLSELARELTPSEHAEARIHRTVHAGQYAFEAADMGRAATLLEEAVAAAPTGWLRAEALLFLARIHYHSHDALSARSLAEEALSEAAQDPDSEDADPDGARSGLGGSR